MGRYFLKVKLSDGIEMDFNTQNKEIVQTQLDEYFHFLNNGASKKSSVESCSSENCVHKAPTENHIEDCENKVWEEQQNEMVDQFIEPPSEVPEVNPDAIYESHIQKEDASIEKLSQYVREKSKDLFGAFVVSAYYIKHNLGQKSFTIKFLNSKLYEASEKLVDHDIISEGLNKGILSIVENDGGPIEYTLNSKGDDYFSKL